MGKKISTQNWYGDISNNENPPKETTEAEIKGEGFFTIGANRGMIDCLEFERARVTAF